jgi:hypothetical protein
MYIYRSIFCIYIIANSTDRCRIFSSFVLCYCLKIEDLFLFYLITLIYDMTFFECRSFISKSKLILIFSFIEISIRILLCRFWVQSISIYFFLLFFCLLLCSVGVLATFWRQQIFFLLFLFFFSTLYRLLLTRTLIHLSFFLFRLRSFILSLNFLVTTSSLVY